MEYQKKKNLSELTLFVKRYLRVSFHFTLYFIMTLEKRNHMETQKLKSWILDQHNDNYHIVNEHENTIQLHTDYAII